MEGTSVAVGSTMSGMDVGSGGELVDVGGLGSVSFGSTRVGGIAVFSISGASVLVGCGGDGLVGVTRRFAIVGVGIGQTL